MLLLIVAFVSFGRRARRLEGERVAGLTSRLEARLDEFARDLADAMGQAEDERRWRPFLDDIAESVDLDEVLERTLEAARRLPGADAALISLETQDGPPILAASGLPAESIELPLYVPRGRGGEEHRSIELSFRYSEDDPEDGRDRAADPQRPGRAARGQRRPARLPDRLQLRAPSSLRRARSCSAWSSWPSARRRRSRTRAASARRGNSPTSTR